MRCWIWIWVKTHHDLRTAWAKPSPCMDAHTADASCSRSSHVSGCISNRTICLWFQGGGFVFVFFVCAQRNEALSLSGAGLRIVISPVSKYLVCIGPVSREKSKCLNLAVFYGSIWCEKENYIHTHTHTYTLQPCDTMSTISSKWTQLNANDNVAC